MEWKESIETPFGKIPDNWKVSRVKDEAMVVTDYVANGSFASLAENVQYKNEEDYAVLIRLVDYNNNFNGNFVFISKESYDFLGKSKLFGDEIIISNVGANVGTVFKCPHLKYKMSLAPNSVMVKFRGDNDFYYYWLKSNGGQGMLHSIVTGSAQPKFNKTNFREMVIPVPPLETQRRIAAILSSLDDKIENNNRINRNLEAQAQALFKSWFVDFEPWGGTMPEDWKEGVLSDIADITMGQSPRGESYNTQGEGVIFYQGCSDFGDRFPSVRMFTTEPARYAVPNSILMSVRAPVGTMNVALEECCIGRGLASLKEKNSYDSFLLYLLESLQNVFDSYNGDGTVFGSINKKSIGNIKIVIPSIKVVESFHKMVSPLDEKIKFNHQESSRLAALRDTLLPKLMKGEIAL